MNIIIISKLIRALRILALGESVYFFLSPFQQSVMSSWASPHSITIIESKELLEMFNLDEITALKIFDKNSFFD